MREGIGRIIDPSFAVLSFTSAGRPRAAAESRVMPGIVIKAHQGNTAVGISGRASLKRT